MPAPPYCSGASQPSRPALPALRHTSRSTIPARSHPSVYGAHSFSKNDRASARNASWSSVKIVRLIMGIHSVTVSCCPAGPGRDHLGQRLAGPLLVGKDLGFDPQRDATVGGDGLTGDPSA